MASAPPQGYSGTLLQAEMPSRFQASFEQRYTTATGVTISPGSPSDYQTQENKRGRELRIYFNDPALAASFNASGYNVTHHHSGYLSKSYAYRVNSYVLWWELVEKHGLQLGLN